MSSTSGRHAEQDVQRVAVVAPQPASRPTRRPRADLHLEVVLRVSGGVARRHGRARGSPSTGPRDARWPARPSRRASGVRGPPRNQTSPRSRPLAAPRMIGSAQIGTATSNVAADVDAVELGGGDADDVEAMAVEQDRAADDRRIARRTRAARTDGRAPTPGAQPFTSSDGASRRPAAGRTPSTGKKLPLTHSACAGRCSPPCARSNVVDAPRGDVGEDLLLLLDLQVERIRQHRPAPHERRRSGRSAP